ncbi:MAG: hypothetical protein HY460_02685 [Parcubacteria group bacterium]|nr:hypothetical protein [Parcubacteria group bacterium]
MESVINFFETTFTKIVTVLALVATAFSSFPTTERPIFVETYPNAVVETLWVAYRDKIQKDGRTIDRDRSYLTTSEGQSYSLLRAVWMDDKEIFDRVLRWTNNNLKKRNDSLFAWKWGQDRYGRWGVLREEGGLSSATDADQDIALALIFAHKRWNQEHYLTQAQKLLDDIWKKEVVIIQGRPYLVAGNWAQEEPHPTINPSYYAFYAYPIFAEVDPAHDWMAVKATSYETLVKASHSVLDKRSSADLPPDWASLDVSSADVLRSVHDDKTTDFSDDAFRVPWRVALDWQWHRDERAREYLESLSFLRREWQQNGFLPSAYTHDGEPLRVAESDSMYGSTHAYFLIVHPEIANEVYRKKIAPLYDPDIEDFGKKLGYYSQNWVWFGMALAAEKLPNLYARAN